MRLEKLSLQNFKNYREAELQFTGNIQVFLGKNGSGKTNLLDAIYYLSFTKSPLNTPDQQNILRGENHFMIKGKFTRNGEAHQVVCLYHQGQKKVIREDEHESPRLSHHIGKYPVVLVAPNDIELIWDGSEMRRKFFDSLLSQTDRLYLENLIVYGQYLKQRNSLLRIFSEQGRVDRDMLDVYDEKLAVAGQYIYQERKTLLAYFHSIFEKHYRFMAGESPEVPLITYRSHLDQNDFRQALLNSLDHDILLQRTGTGIHRDDFLFSLNRGDLKQMGSQGQQKSFLIALKLTEFEILAKDKKLKPLLLLDDIFDKLDDDRIHQLMLLVANGTFGQLFITDARSMRSRDLLASLGIPATLTEISDGRVRSAGLQP